MPEYLVMMRLQGEVPQVILTQILSATLFTPVSCDLLAHVISISISRLREE